MRQSPFVWVLVAASVVGGGCAALAERNEEERNAVTLFERQVGEDLGRLATTITDLGLRAAEVGARDAVECAPVFGDCAMCTTFDGDLRAGSLERSLEAACVETSAASAGAATYELTTSELLATYEGEPGGYFFDATGSRTAFLSLDAGSATERWTASWSLDRLAAETAEGALDYLSLGMTYPAFEGFTWTVQAAGEGGSLSGTASHDDGGLCSILGSWDDVRVDCDLLGGEL